MRHIFVYKPGINLFLQLTFEPIKNFNKNVYYWITLFDKRKYYWKTRFL